MRLVIIGITPTSIATARLLIGSGHDVVIVDKDKQRIDDIAEDLDCAFVHGDGSRPRILREVGPKDTDALLCLTGDDQDNIISSLVGRSLGFAKVVTKISDPEYAHICSELGLDHTISVDQTTARSLVDTVEERNAVELSTVLRDDVRFFVLTARPEDACAIKDLSLPDDTRVLYAYRDGALELTSDDFELREGDDVILLTRSKHLDALRERWQP